jgi:putative hydrolase of HD superfamily
MIASVITFLLEIEKLKGITRKTKPLGLERYENSAEHSWQLALFAYALEPYADVPLDMERVIRMLLVHDIGEIDTGDTIAFVQDGQAERKVAELAAIERIFGHLPPSQGEPLRDLWLEFEAEETPEAKFAHAVDRAMPVLLNLENHGQSWRENDISYERVMKRVEPPIRTGCPKLWAYLAPRLEDAREQGYFGA